MNYLIDVAIGLCQVGNFNSAMAIALGLDSKPVSRLHKVWKKIDNAKINILKVIFIFQIEHPCSVLDWLTPPELFFDWLKESHDSA